MMHEFSVEEFEAGQRLDVFVAARLYVSRGRAQKLLENATVNDKPAKSSQSLRSGDRVLVSEAEPQTHQPAVSTENSLLPPILYEDEHLLVLNKPRWSDGARRGRGAAGNAGRCAARTRTHLSQVGPPERAGIVHRLDKDTSGIMMVCKTDAAHWKLAKISKNAACAKITRRWCAACRRNEAASKHPFSSPDRIARRWRLYRPGAAP
jgi:23S rRNA pseudouridine1911/1915/1917 synthase